MGTNAVLNVTRCRRPYGSYIIGATNNDVTVHDCDTDQAAAHEEGLLINRYDTGRDRDASIQPSASIKRTSSDSFQPFAECRALQCQLVACLLGL